LATLVDATQLKIVLIFRRVAQSSQRKPGMTVDATVAGNFKQNTSAK
jgi:hypothetical protein